MKSISFIFLLSLFLSGCTISSISDIFDTPSPVIEADNEKKASDKILSATGNHIEKVSIVSVEEIKKDYNTRESYQECYTKKYDKNQDEANLITSFFNTSKDSHIASVEFCETKYRNKKETRLKHYLVKYEYEGNVFSYTTMKKPNLDEKIKIKVIAVPSKYKGRIDK